MTALYPQTLAQHGPSRSLAEYRAALAARLAEAEADETLQITCAVLAARIRDVDAEIAARTP